jgi:hypothetical protein
MLKVVENRDEREAGEELLRLDEVAREGSRRMLIETLKAEVDDYVALGFQRRTLGLFRPRRSLQPVFNSPVISR